jgi:dynein light chain LC8-type
MSEGEFKIYNVEMHANLQDEVKKVAIEAFKKFNEETQIAKFIKQRFDNDNMPTWHCVVGRSFGSYVTHETKHFVFFKYGQTYVLLFKSQ